MMRIAWFIRHNANIFSANAIAAIIFIKNNFFLQHHYQFACFCMFFKKIFHIYLLYKHFSIRRLQMVSYKQENRYN